MKYTMVKQFSNSAFDNMYNFYYKIVDFLKLFVEVMWSFIEIWIAFYLIFYNIFMYFYYLFLYAIDRSTESQSSVYFWRRYSRSASYVPKIEVPSGPSAVRPLRAAAAVFRPERKSLKSGPASVSHKGSSSKSLLEFLEGLLLSFRNFFKKAFSPIYGFISDRLKPVKEKSAAEPEGKSSLIDEYIREYESKRKTV